MPPPVRLPDLVVLDTQTQSNAISFMRGGIGYGVRAIAIHAPTSVGTAGTITVNVRRVGGVWKDLMSGGSAVTIGAGECIIIDEIPFQELSLACSDPGADITFEVTGREER